jgi:hypothetical protein
MVTHNASAAMVDDRTVEMHDGRIVGEALTPRATRGPPAVAEER